jgi:hypothetical protein
MYVRVVTFELKGITADDYRAHAAAVAGAFTAWPGLVGKIWLSDEGRNRYGGVYLFASKADADRSRATPLFAGMIANPAFSNLMIEEYDTVPELTTRTCPALAAHRPTAAA